MQLKEALFNWLQIQIVYLARPSDRSARDTVLFFEKMLKEDFKVTGLSKEKQDPFYVLTYTQDQEKKSEQFPCEVAQRLLADIQAEPKYNQVFE